MTQDTDISDAFEERIEMLGEEIGDTIEATVKKWWASKTIIVNALVLALAAAESQLNMLQPLVPVNVYAVIAFVLPVVNAVLRFVTKQGVTL